MKKAFTLIELLVVIAIIAILAAILFPVFAQAKAAAKKTVSISNFKQIGLASVMYSGDADDVFPLREQLTATGAIPADRRDFPITWREEIGPYVKSGISQYNWVVNPPGGTVTGPLADKDIWESPVRPKIYGIIDQHTFLGTGQVDPYNNYGKWAPVSMTSVSKPADVALLIEKGVNPDYNSPGRDFVISWWAWAPTSQSQLRGNRTVPEGDNNVWPSSSMPRYRHSGNSTTLAFVDGHAATHVKGRIDWCREINVAGMGDDWLTQPGNACAGVDN